MPRRRKRRQKQNFRRRPLAQFQVYPVFYRIKAGQSAVTTVNTLSETFDRTRAFRIASFTYEFTSTNSAISIYLKAFGPVSSADNVWTSRPILLPTGSVRRGRVRIPVTITGWYPSDTSLNTYLFQVVTVCVSKAGDSVCVGHISFKIDVQPYEPTSACPTESFEISSAMDLRKAFPGGIVSLEAMQQ